MFSWFFPKQARKFITHYSSLITRNTNTLSSNEIASFDIFVVLHYKPVKSQNFTGTFDIYYPNDESKLSK